MSSHTLKPIGRIRADESGFALLIDEPFRPGLAELNGFGHVQVLWWAHHLDRPEFRSVTTLERPYRDGPERIGVFATRSPARPDPIGLTPAAVLSLDQESGVVGIGYIDADHDTPILDIKPYTPAIDRVRDLASPAWCADWPQWYEDSGTFD